MRDYILPPSDRHVTWWICSDGPKEQQYMSLKGGRGMERGIEGGIEGGILGREVQLGEGQRDR